MLRRSQNTTIKIAKDNNLHISFPAIEGVYKRRIYLHVFDPK
jgi:hypothetical protein